MPCQPEFASPPSGTEIMSPLPYEIALALRYLRPKRTFVSIITLNCFLGVSLCVALMIIGILETTGLWAKFWARNPGLN